MKSTKILLLFCLLLAVFSMQSCIKDDCTNEYVYTQYTPVYKKADEIRLNVKAGDAQPLRHPGKIYYFDHFLFINELHEGIHIFDNADPANPVNLAFINIPGNVDMAVQNNLLYADNYMDLVTIDITNPLDPKLVKRNENVFSSLGFHEQLGFLVYYEEQEVTQTFKCDEANIGGPWFWMGGDVLVLDSPGAQRDFENSVGGAVKTSSGSGIGGSMARFTIVGDYLYSLEPSELEVFDLGGDGCPKHQNTVLLNFWNMETLFPYGKYLFMGATNGMYIYDNSNPVAPVYLTHFAHMSSCDPVFVENDIAYVTLNGNGGCENFSNQLDVLDISDIKSPRLIKTYPMEDPKGLSVENNTLFLCDGKAGMKVFDTQNLLTIDENLLEHLKSFSTYDVIALPDSDLLLVVGPDGFFQFDASDRSNLQLLSKIGIEN